MLDRLVALFRRPATVPAVRRFDGATGGRRGQGFSTFNDINAEIGAAGWSLRRRSLHAARNNGWISNGIASWVSATVGTGMKPRSTHDDPAVREDLNRRFRRWQDVADADGLADLGSLQAIAVRTMIEGGESFCHLIATPDGLRLRLLDADMVPSDLSQELGDGRRIIQGIEFNADGRRAAYHVRRFRPIVPTFGNDLVRIPAEDMLHMYQVLAPGQVRGIPWLAPVLLRAHEADVLEDAAIVKQKIAAMFAAFIYDPSGSTGAQFNGTAANGAMEVSLEPGSTKALPPGFDIKFADPPEADPIVELLKLELRGIAAGLGTCEHLVTGDLSAANYSSLRGGLNEFGQRVEQVQYFNLAHQLLGPARRRWLLLEIVAGRIVGDLDELEPVEWIAPARPPVDPEKDAKASAELVRNRFASRAEIVAGRGWDIEALDAEIAADPFRAPDAGATPKEAPNAGA